MFAWCTDFSPEDSRLEGEPYQLKVLERSARRVVFEDLEETGTGWVWTRDVVDLRPPNRWHMEGGGNRRDVVADYRLSALPGGRTRLNLRWRRRPRVPEAKPLTKAQREASTMRAWKRFAAAMKRDHHRSLRSGGHRTTRRARPDDDRTATVLSRRRLGARGGLPWAIEAPCSQ